MAHRLRFESGDLETSELTRLRSEIEECLFNVYHLEFAECEKLNSIQ